MSLYFSLWQRFTLLIFGDLSRMGTLRGGVLLVHRLRTKMFPDLVREGSFSRFMFSRVPRVLSPSLSLCVRQFMSLVINNERVLLCKPPPLEISQYCFTASGMWDARCCSLKYIWEHTCGSHKGLPCILCLCLFLRRGLSHVAWAWVWELARDRMIAFPT